MTTTRQKRKPETNGMEWPKKEMINEGILACYSKQKQYLMKEHESKWKHRKVQWMKWMTNKLTWWISTKNTVDLINLILHERYQKMIWQMNECLMNRTSIERTKIELCKLNEMTNAWNDPWMKWSKWHLKWILRYCHLAVSTQAYFPLMPLVALRKPKT